MLVAIMLKKLPVLVRRKGQGLFGERNRDQSRMMRMKTSLLDQVVPQRAAPNAKEKSLEVQSGGSS